MFCRLSRPPDPHPPSSWRGGTVPSTSPREVSGNPALIVNLSSILGSIAENTKQGGLYPYRASKSALNAVTRSLSLDLANDKVEAVAIHPGWVRTDMGGQHAPLSPEQSVAGVLAQINSHTSDNNGGFIDQEGKTLPW